MSSSFYPIFFIEDQLYNSSMIKEQRSFTPEYNEAVIKLIRYKIKPLHILKTGNNSLHQHFSTPNLVQGGRPNGVSSPQSVHSFYSMPAHYPLPKETEKGQKLLQKVRNYILKQRRQRPNHEQRVELKQFIEMLQKRVVEREKGKRKSIELNLRELETKRKLLPLSAISTQHLQIKFNQQQRSLMNAKIRRKLNHRKIIEIAKRN